MSFKKIQIQVRIKNVENDRLKEINYYWLGACFKFKQL